MLKKIFLVLVVAIVAFAAVAAMQPSEFRVSRSATIDAPVAAVFPHVNNLSLWGAWSPWMKMDPEAKASQEGPEAGVGAISRWAGKEIGEGSMTITESLANEKILFRLDFVKPMAGTNVAEFTFAPDGEKTLVTWSMSGEKDFIAKAVGLVMNCEKMVGEQFEAGLANLGEVVAAGK